MRLDRRLNLQDAPDFLRAVQPKERAWWRIVLTAALWGVGGFFVMLVAYSAVFGIESGLMPRLHAPVRYEGDTLYWGVGLTAEVDRLLRALAIFGSYALAIPAAAALVNRRPMRSWITAAARFRWRLLLAGLVLFGAAVAVGVLVQGAATGWPEYPPLLDRREALPVRLIYLGAAVVVIPVVVMAEEVLTRGWLLQLTSAFTRNLLVILAVNAVVFSILHFDPNPFANVGHFYTGVVLGYMVLRLGGLEFAIGVHAANILVVALFQRSVVAEQATSAGGWGSLASDLLITTAGLALTELVARWAPLRRWTGAEQTLASPELHPRGLPASA